VNERIDRKIEEGNFEGFGKELHTYQDSWSHQSFVNDHGLSHEPDYTYIQDRWKTDGRDMEMARVVYSKMEAFLDWNPGYRAFPTAPFPEQFMMEYLRLEDNKDKEIALKKAGLNGYGQQLIGYRTVQTRDGKLAMPIYEWRFERFE